MSGKVPLSSKARLKKAKELFADFTGHEADIVGTVDMPEHDTLMVIGSLDAVCYTTVRDGNKEKYIHEFETPASRPLLCVSHDGKQLYIVGGRYEFLDSGINDR